MTATTTVEPFSYKGFGETGPLKINVHSRFPVANLVMYYTRGAMDPTTPARSSRRLSSQKPEFEFEELDKCTPAKTPAKAKTPGKKARTPAIVKEEPVAETEAVVQQSHAKKAATPKKKAATPGKKAKTAVKEEDVAETVSEAAAYVQQKHDQFEKELAMTEAAASDDFEE